jgi:hypothetical protein
MKFTQAEIRNWNIPNIITDSYRYPNKPYTCIACCSSYVMTFCIMNTLYKYFAVCDDELYVVWNQLAALYFGGYNCRT